MEYTKMLSEYKDILLPEDVQKILHIGRNTVYKYLAEGKTESEKETETTGRFRRMP